MTTQESRPAVQEQLTSRQFLRDLAAFANNNPAFRTGIVDEIELKICEGERVEDSEDAQGHVQLGYEYTARRYRFHPDSGQRTITAFELSLVATQDSIALPPHIAVGAYGLEDPEEAVEAAGLCTLHRKLMFSISTAQRTLATCESYTYIDAEEDIVNSVCSCEEQSTRSVLVDIDEDDDEDLTTVPYLSQSSRIEHEALDPQTPEEAIELWTALENLEPFLVEPDDQENLRMANFIFVGMKKTMARQLGVVL
jgi:hypothetical protein